MFPTKTISYGAHARSHILAGINTIANAVKVTLGPCGKTVILEKEGGYPYMTKDGVTVARNIRVSDAKQNIGVELIREVASKTGILAGDGTTTSCVLAQFVAQEGLKLMNAGFNPGELKRGMDKAVKVVCDYVDAVAIPIKDNQDLKRVALIASNDDEEIADILVKAYDIVGKEGVITIEEGPGSGLDLEVLDGMQLDEGLHSSSHLFVTNMEKGTCEFDDVHIFVHEKSLLNMQPVFPILDALVQTGKPILIIAEKVADGALSFLVTNRMKGCSIAAISSPYRGEKRKTIMQDIATFTGGVVINQDLGIVQKNIKPGMIGCAQKVIVSGDKTIIMNGGGDPDKLAARVAKIRALMKSDDCSEHDKEFLRSRLGGLTSGVAIIKVGAASKMELQERLDRVDDALCSTRAAWLEGVVAGGGVTLLRAAAKIADMAFANDTQKKGADIILMALASPLRQILDNAGIESASMIIHDVVNNDKPTWGYNARTEAMCDMIDAGVVDAAKVVKTSLRDAISAASMVLSTEALVTIDRKDAE